MKEWVKPKIENKIEIGDFIIYEKYDEKIIDLVHIKFSKVVKIIDDYLIQTEDDKINHMSISYILKNDNVKIKYSGYRYYDNKTNQYIPTIEEYRELAGVECQG